MVYNGTMLNSIIDGLTMTEKVKPPLRPPSIFIDAQGRRITETQANQRADRQTARPCLRMKRDTVVYHKLPAEMRGEV